MFLLGGVPTLPSVEDAEEVESVLFFVGFLRLGSLKLPSGLFELGLEMAGGVEFSSSLSSSKMSSNSADLIEMQTLKVVTSYSWNLVTLSPHIFYPV